MGKEMASIKKIRALSTLNELIDSSELLVVYFYSDLSSECCKLAPLFEELVNEREFRSVVSSIKVDVDDCEVIAEKFEVKETPTFMFFKKGARIDQVVGDDVLKLRAAIERLTKRVYRLTSMVEYDKMIALHSLMLIHFFAEWVEQSQDLEPFLETLAEEMENVGKSAQVSKIKFLKVDVNENEELAQEFDICALPTFLIVKDGAVIDRFVSGQHIQERVRDAIHFLHEKDNESSFD